MTGLVITEAGEADLDALCGLLGQLFSIEQDFEPQTELQQHALSLLLKSKTAVVLTARFDGKVVGMATMQTVISTAEGGLSGWVEDVVITKAFRGRGVGTELLKALEKISFRRGCKRLMLLADKDNTPALEFYKSKGWGRTSLQAWKKKKD